MHEYTLTANIIEEIIQAVDAEGNCKVLEATLGFGPFAHGSFDSIQFWWEVLSKDTVAEGSKLVYKPLDGELYCPSCKESSIITNGNEDLPKDEYLQIFSCPKCHSLQTEIRSGDEIILIDIEVIQTNLVQT